MIYEPANLLLCDEPYGLTALRALAPHLMNEEYKGLFNWGDSNGKKQ